MSKITNDFIYKPFPVDKTKVVDNKNRALERVEAGRNKKKDLIKSGEEAELKIISNFHPSPGPVLLWKSDSLLKVCDVCDYIDECGLPAILKVIGGSPLLKLDKNDKILAFTHGLETRRTCEEQDSGRCYTICCEKRHLSERPPEDPTDHTIINRWRISAQPHYMTWFQEESEYLAEEERNGTINKLKDRKRGARYSSKFIIVISMKNDLLGYEPFLISEDMGLMFSIAVGIDDCSTEQWTEYCNAHHRTTKQSSIRNLIKEIKQEKLYLDIVQDNNYNSDVIPFYLDNYVISSPPQKFSYMTSRSDESHHRIPMEGEQQLSSRSTSSSNLHPAHATDRGSKLNQSKRNHPIMGTSAKEALKTSGLIKPVNSTQVEESVGSLYPSASASKHLICVPGKTARQFPNSSLDSKKGQKEQSPNGYTSSTGRSSFPTRSISSTASPPSDKINNFTKLKNRSNLDVMLDDGYFTKSEMGVPF